MKLGISPINWSNEDLRELGGEIPLETCLQEMKEAGYSGTELGYKFPLDPEEMKLILAEYQIQLAAAWFGMELSNIDQEPDWEKLKTFLNRLTHVGCTNINLAETYQTIHPMIDQNLELRYQMNEEQWQVFLSRLESACGICTSHGVTPGFHQHMGTVIQSKTDLQRLMKDTEHFNMGLCFDSGHLFWAGVDPHWTITEYGKRITHVHLKDVRIDVLEMVEEQDSFLGAIKKGVFTVPGDGLIDFNKVLQKLSTSNYQGWLIVEAEQDPKLADPFMYARKSQRYLKKLLKNYQ